MCAKCSLLNQSKKYIHNMDYIRLLINIVLSGLFYYFFGQVNIERFSNAGVSVTKYDEIMSEFPPPGEAAEHDWTFFLIVFFKQFLLST